MNLDIHIIAVYVMIFGIAHRNTQTNTYKPWFFCSVGYKPFLHAIRGQIQILSKITETAPPALSLNTDLDLTDCSVEEGNLSPSAMTMRTEADTPHDSPIQIVDPPKQSECSIS